MQINMKKERPVATRPEDSFASHMMRLGYKLEPYRQPLTSDGRRIYVARWVKNK